MGNIQDGSCGKMYRAPSLQVKARTSDVSSKASAKSRTRIFLFLDLRSGRMPETSWQINFLSHGEFSTLNFGESPREGNASTLSQILEEEVPKKYYLSPRACQGILRRASNRGKELPEVLRIALERQATFA